MLLVVEVILDDMCIGYIFQLIRTQLMLLGCAMVLMRIIKLAMLICIRCLSPRNQTFPLLQ